MSWSAVSRERKVETPAMVQVAADRFEISTPDRKHVQVRLDPGGVFLAHQDFSNGQDLRLATIPVEEFAQIIRTLIEDRRKNCSGT